MKEEKRVSADTRSDNPGKIIPRAYDEGNDLPCNVPTRTNAIATPASRILGIG